MKRVCILLSSALALMIVEAPPPRSARPLTVVGEASDEARPDVAWISLTIRDQKPTAADAANENARRANAVINALTGAGVEAKDIATLGLALDPVWSSGNSPHSVVAFEATNRLSVRAQPVAKAGPIIAQAVLAGPNIRASASTSPIARRARTRCAPRRWRTPPIAPRSMPTALR